MSIIITSSNEGWWVSVSHQVRVDEYQHHIKWGLMSIIITSSNEGWWVSVSHQVRVDEYQHHIKWGLMSIIITSSNEGWWVSVSHQVRVDEYQHHIKWGLMSIIITSSNEGWWVSSLHQVMRVDEYHHHIKELKKQCSWKWCLSSLLSQIHVTEAESCHWIEIEIPPVKTVINTFPCLVESSVVSKCYVVTTNISLCSSYRCSFLLSWYMNFNA